MKGIASVTALLSVFVSFAKAELVVIPYDGPEECSAEELIEPEKYVRIHYVGTIDHWSKTGEPGEIFDTTHGRMTTLDFQVGKGQGIPGLDRGLLGLCNNTKATITVPPEHGYGDKGFDDFNIPPGATLHFDVEIVDVQSEIEERNLFLAMDDDKSGDLSKEEVLDYMEEKLGRRSLPPGFWESQDTDGDGYISWDEFTGPKGDEKPLTAIDMFERIDEDNSGYITREELADFAMRVHKMELKDEVWRREDKNEDGKISWDEFTGGKGRHKPEAVLAYENRM